MPKYPLDPHHIQIFLPGLSIDLISITPGYFTGVNGPYGITYGPSGLGFGGVGVGVGVGFGEGVNYAFGRICSTGNGLFQRTPMEPQ